MNYSINIPEYEVSQFNRALKEVIDNNFDYVRIRGEISEVKIATRGQLYLTLKDNKSILSGVIWDQKIKYLFLVGMTIKLFFIQKIILFQIWQKFYYIIIK